MTVRIIVGIVIGGGIGFAVGYFGRCSSGACPLTSNPYISSFYGAIVGLLLALFAK